MILFECTLDWVIYEYTPHYNGEAIVFFESGVYISSYSHERYILNYKRYILNYEAYYYDGFYFYDIIWSRS